MAFFDHICPDLRSVELQHTVCEPLSAAARAGVLYSPLRAVTGAACPESVRSN